ncbi:hypothetical protein FHG87_000572, partial [Trinorchestia longiramus]
MASTVSFLSLLPSVSDTSSTEWPCISPKMFAIETLMRGYSESAQKSADITRLLLGSAGRLCRPKKRYI